ncbi:hypothetical protein BDA99DRAFT_541453 [Phascolomyces articulosus]|uniref:Uncharacterized protein n=1 Tax=Phascolomyces articulosus TaxID=60185 RepID=A0AAD5PBH9_9FUNG|nr:hypothetical protein BDA99DRAFT_541453 [Phascolomyces articulosus]
MNSSNHAVECLTHCCRTTRKQYDKNEKPSPTTLCNVNVNIKTAACVWFLHFLFNLHKGKREGSIKWKTFGAAVVMQQTKDFVISGYPTRGFLYFLNFLCKSTLLQCLFQVKRKSATVTYATPLEYTYLVINIIVSKVYTTDDQTKCLLILEKTKPFQSITSEKWATVSTVCATNELFNTHCSNSDIMSPLKILYAFDPHLASSKHQSVRITGFLYKDIKSDALNLYNNYLYSAYTRIKFQWPSSFFSWVNMKMIPIATCSSIKSLTEKAASLLIGIKVKAGQHYVYQYKIENERWMFLILR